MIAKEKTPKRTKGRKERAGDSAEQQMAFYLDRAFGERDDVHVFNDLRIERARAAAQIDHLVIHPWGMIIIESKSVTGEIQINPQNEFVRLHGRKRTGMPSPILQARRQKDLLVKLLDDRKEELLGKVLLGLGHAKFGVYDYEVMVAISDQGIIQRPDASLPELVKADQITDAVSAIIARHRKAARLLSKVDGDYGLFKFREDEFDRVVAFLTDAHAPLPERKPQPGSASAADPESNLPIYLCKHCKGEDLSILFGTSYYFKCHDCGGNSPIKNPCRGCGEQTKTRKRGDKFSSVCSVCGQIELFFINKKRELTSGGHGVHYIS